MENNFEWTDELVKDYGNWARHLCGEDLIGEFKKGHIRKTKLFTTADGVEVFEGDRVWYVTKENFIIDFHDFDKNDFCVPERYLYFSTESLANQYILANKPVKVSYTELCDFMRKEVGPITPYKIYEFFTKKITSQNHGTNKF
jgi:hypothetical protein